MRPSLYLHYNMQIQIKLPQIGEQLMRFIAGTSHHRKLFSCQPKHDVFNSKWHHLLPSLSEMQSCHGASWELTCRLLFNQAFHHNAEMLTRFIQCGGKNHFCVSSVLCWILTAVIWDTKYKAFFLVLLFRSLLCVIPNASCMTPNHNTVSNMAF